MFLTEKVWLGLASINVAFAAVGGVINPSMRKRIDRASACLAPCIDQRRTGKPVALVETLRSSAVSAADDRLGQRLAGRDSDSR